MNSSLRELALRSLNEAKGQYDKAKRNGYFIFKAQKLLADCESLLLKDQYNDIIQTCNHILALIDSEEEYSLLDSNRSNISYVKTVIKAANEDSADVSFLMDDIFGLDDTMLDGDQYKLQKDLNELFPKIDALQTQHKDQWGRFIAMDLNVKMDELLIYYKDLSKELIEYLRGPIKELTDHLERIMNDIRDERYDGLLITVKGYYYHYYQLERFLRAEIEQQAQMLQTDAQKAAEVPGGEGKGDIAQQGPAPRFSTIVMDTSQKAAGDPPAPLSMARPQAVEVEKVQAASGTVLTPLKSKAARPPLETMTQIPSAPLHVNLHASNVPPTKTTVTTEQVPAPSKAADEAPSKTPEVAPIKKVVKAPRLKGPGTEPAAKLQEEQPAMAADAPPQVPEAKPQMQNSDHVEERPVAELEPLPQDEEEPISWPPPAAMPPAPKAELTSQQKTEIKKLDALALKSEINCEYDEALSMYERLIEASPNKNKYIDRREICYKKLMKDIKGQVGKKKKKKK